MTMLEGSVPSGIVRKQVKLIRANHQLVPKMPRQTVALRDYFFESERPVAVSRSFSIEPVEGSKCLCCSLG